VLAHGENGISETTQHSAYGRKWRSHIIEDFQITTHVPFKMFPLRCFLAQVKMEDERIKRVAAGGGVRTAGRRIKKRGETRTYRGTQRPCTYDCTTGTVSTPAFFISR
jgi:hypothetical protein